MLATVLVALAGYSVSAAVSAERRAVERLARENADLARQVTALRVELAIRMRLPQLQRWNDEVLRLAPADARQFLVRPAELALYALPPPEPLGPAPRPVAHRGPPSPGSSIAPGPPPASAPAPALGAPGDPPPRGPNPSLLLVAATPAAPTLAADPPAGPAAEATP
ncbi:MAG: hypothetical protein NZM40_05695 [Sphingomonadaceae bacterium]|uniref:hypothetical protein n=1 Tax=Thermaurantiacus sp. TaxID=2820283 RepID=UPI00298EFFC2|nr:hypothetical protein [Thermaurantiacus sp.]MCS6986911.1 hypothetical protein [Sphingomonadaceae bacterium]MDW8415489.1 hypothetical protein [Thermaurantiacus sp.]